MKNRELTSLATARRRYGVILADPPWPFQTYSGPKIPQRAKVAHYETMPVADIKALPVGRVAAEDCALFLWVTWPLLSAGLEVMRAWGFKYKTCGFAWFKGNTLPLFPDDFVPRMGMGYWTRANSEVCLLGTRGRPKRLHADVRQAITEPARENSRKPDCAHERIERLVAGPYLELFARERRKGWDAWGNEVGKFKAAA